MAIDDTIEGIYPTRKHPGVLVKGANQAWEAEVFDDIMQMLYDFYGSKEVQGEGLIMPTQLHERGGKKYHLPVYFNDAPQPNFRYFDADTGKNLGRNLPVERVFELRQRGVNINREELRSGNPRKYGHVSVIQLDDEEYRQFVKGWDFDHAPLEVKKAVFLVYFNAYDDNKLDAEAKSMADRSRFLAAAQA